MTRMPIAKPITAKNVIVIAAYILSYVVEICDDWFSHVTSKLWLFIPVSHSRPTTFAEWDSYSFAEVDCVWNPNPKRPALL